MHVEFDSSVIFALTQTLCTVTMQKKKKRSVPICFAFSLSHGECQLAFRGVLWLKVIHLWSPCEQQDGGPNMPTCDWSLNHNTFLHWKTIFLQRALTAAHIFFLTTTGLKQAYGLTKTTNAPLWVASLKWLLEGSPEEFITVPRVALEGKSRHTNTWMHLVLKSNDNQRTQEHDDHFVPGFAINKQLLITTLILAVGSVL